MMQIELALVRNTDPETSYIAAKSVYARVPTLEQRILEWLDMQGDQGGTTEEIALALKLDRVTISPRMKPLMTKGQVVQMGRRSGKSNKPAIVWGVK
jgi:response regulator of citrate/malate metabolism